MGLTKEVLVTGATGAQGGAVVDALIALDIPARALVRDPSSEAARRLNSRGVRLFTGDFDDVDAITAAADGVSGLFSVQVPGDGEARAAQNLVTAAQRAGVITMVHTSVARADEHEQFVEWPSGRWPRDYWLGKANANDAVRGSGVAHWVILKPAFMMDNFINPKAAHMFPSLAEATLSTTYGPHTRLDLVAAADVGRFAAAAFANPSRFDRSEITLAAEALTMDEVAAVLSTVTSTPITTRYVSTGQAIADGQVPGVIDSQQWAAAEGYQVDITACRNHGIPLEDFASWAADHRNDLPVGGRPDHDTGKVSD